MRPDRENIAEALNKYKNETTSIPVSEEPLIMKYSGHFPA